MSRYDEREYYEQLIENARLARSKALGDAIATGLANVRTFMKILQAAMRRHMASQHLWHGME
jgi:PleD family two-component response regulator